MCSKDKAINTGKRPIVIDGDDAYIELTKGMRAVIDAKNVDKVKHWNWCAYLCVDRYYAKRNERGKTIKLHRFLIDAPDNMHVDHIDGDPLNNRESNLRLVTQQQNNCNNKMRSRNRSGFKGVCWHKATGKWIARIGFNGKKIHLGLFDNPEDGYKAYCEASKKYHKEYGRLS